MNKILITTNNKDKAQITKSFVDKFYPDATVHSLADAGITGDIEEIGSISDRALDKAKYFKKEAEAVNLNYDAYIGIDDGFAVPEKEIDTPESYEVTDAVLNGEFPIGTTIINKRAYALLFANGSHKETVTETPFVFQGNNEKVIREEGKYPLTQVLGPVDSLKSLAELTNEEQTAYYMIYAQQPLEFLLKVN